MHGCPRATTSTPTIHTSLVEVANAVVEVEVHMPMREAAVAVELADLQHMTLVFDRHQIDTALRQIINARAMKTVEKLRLKEKLRRLAEGLSMLQKNSHRIRSHLLPIHMTMMSIEAVVVEVPQLVVPMSVINPCNSMH